MTYVIAQPCIDTKDKSCIDVCPVEAIFPEDALPADWEAFTKINAAWVTGGPAAVDEELRRFLGG
jgi:ferredoxin